MPINATDFGVSVSNPDNTAAINAIIAGAPTTGQKVNFPDGILKVSGEIPVIKPMKLVGEGRRGTTFQTSSPTATVFKTLIGDVEMSDFGIDVAPGVVRIPGARHIEIASGAGVDSLQMENLALLNCATGVLGAAGFFWMSKMLVEILGGGVGCGVRTTNSSGIFVDRTFFFGIDLPFPGNPGWAGGQPFAGLDLSDCGDAHVTDVELLCTGVGVKLSPTTGQICTSHFYTNVLADHCMTGWELMPTGGGSVNTMKMVNTWGCSSVHNGLKGRTSGPGSTIFDIDVTNGTFSGNGNSMSGATPCRTAENGVQWDGNPNSITKVKFIGGAISDHPLSADMSTYTGVDGMTILGTSFGNRSFPSRVGLSNAGAASRVRATDCQFEAASYQQIQNISTGVGNYMPASANNMM